MRSPGSLVGRRRSPEARASGEALSSRGPVELSPAIGAVVGLGILLAACGSSGQRSETLPCVQAACGARSQRIESIQVIQAQGARPRFAPNGSEFVFDRVNADGFSDLYLSDLNGTILASLTDGGSGLPQRNNGNGVFDPSGQFVIFVSEAETHFADQVKYLGDSGVGLFSNLWVTDLEGSRFWQLTDTPVKQRLLDGIPAYAVVNPRFSRDGKLLIWTERYADGGSHNWGEWRIQGAEFAVEGGVPRIENPRTLYVPQQGNFVTFMGELPSGEWILAGNLDGQHEYGMDQYRFDPRTGTLVNLQNTPLLWEEDASVSPGGRIVYMTNADSAFGFDFDDPNWAAQPMEREYHVMDAGGGGRERLTFFNDPSAPEYLGHPVLAVASDFSPDGRYLAGTIGVDFGKGGRRELVLKIMLITLREPW